MVKRVLCSFALPLTILFIAPQCYAGDVLLGEEPSFKGWEGRGGMIRTVKPEDNKETANSKEQSIAKGAEQEYVKQPVKQTTETARSQSSYIGFGGGVSINHDSDIEVDGYSGTGTVEYDLGYGLNVVAGYKFDPIRIEAEFGYRVSDVDKLSGAGGSISLSGVDLTAMSYMVNGYYDVKTSSQISPFFGAGIGLINGEVDVDGEDVDDTVFGYQLTAGVTSEINKNVNLDLYYRYQATATDFEKYGVNLSYENSSVFAGLRFSFN